MADHDIPLPSPVSTPKNGTLSLSDQINASTRSTHTQLNRLITVRLPLALPPYTSNASLYISGLLFIAPIYITFETLWRNILDAPLIPTTLKKSFDACDPESPLIDSQSLPILSNFNTSPLVHQPRVCSRTHSLLSHLQLPGLLRSGRLRADIRTITGTPEHEIAEQLAIVSKNGKLSEFIAHTKQSVEANPHVLLAYAWVLYMALFSGGRYLRASLQDAGPEFWCRSPSPVRPYSVTEKAESSTEPIYERHTSERRTSRSDNTFDERRPQLRTSSRSESTIQKLVPGLQFFNFLGDEDGEDIKFEFKKRIAEAEILLTHGEKEDIVRESQHIFTFMVEMVAELDSVCGTNEDDIESSKQKASRSLMHSRDSVSVTRERNLRREGPLSEKVLSQPQRKGSLLETLVTGPVAKLVRFNDVLPEVNLDIVGKGVEKIVKPLGRQLSRTGPVAANAHEEGKRTGRQLSMQDWDGILFAALTSAVPVLVLVLALLAWYYLQ